MDEPKKLRSCPIDKDFLATEINGWLRQGLTTARVNQSIMEVDPNHKGYAAQVFSRHRTKCLGMAKLQKGRVARVGITQTRRDIELAERVSDAQMLRTYKAALFDRLKNNPASVATKELVSAISALARAGAGEGDEMDKLTQAMGDLSEDGPNPAPSEDS